METLKQVKIKEKEKKNKKRVSQTNEKIFETKVCSRNLIKWINAWVVPLERFLKWMREEFE